MSTWDLYSIYADMGSVALAASRCVCLWVEEPSLTHPDGYNPRGLDKILWQGKVQVYWLQRNEPTYNNILSKIDRVLECGYRYRLLIGATREGIRLLRSASDEWLLLAEMVPIQRDWDVNIWWSVNILG